ncbi:adenine phosphoribosyltransferase [Haliangium ochraceum]|uniref:Adenine phosphoribosyltransferase n=1 Tax=Haliangium ochraceum (strain DSM 14365 / JCM 11303 / SMP-2) TaxID=502025 RepID=D0LY89_HALO1|nr:adenine phosphoribosyltransferase [Haliangium ochraceum]ACY16239.1 adenine phosphoribosyltransferase [Haliangium ochraceum DSM 14365]
MSSTTEAAIREAIRDIPDFPKPGIVFKDITPLLADAALFDRTLDALSERVASHKPDAIVGIESRGFLFAAPVARKLGLPLQLARKPGKLPYETVGVSYDLEYGSDRIEMHVDAIAAGNSYAIIDDLIATGGTAAATAELIEQQKAQVACFAFVIELSFLSGVQKLAGRPYEALVQY